MNTTIQIDKKIKERLEELKIHPRESYNQVIERLIEIRTDDGILSNQTLKNIESALEDVRKNRVYSTTQAKKKLGLR